MWTICLSLIGVGALSLLVYKKYNGSVSIEKLFKAGLTDGIETSIYGS